MILEILRRRRPRKSAKDKDEFDRLIEVIEKFAPAKYAGEREMYYYNYRMMPLYARPLLTLLELLSRARKPPEGDAGFAGELFQKLKAFYDPKDRLSPEQTRADEGLRRKHRELYLFFYGRKDLPPEKGQE